MDATVITAIFTGIALLVTSITAAYIAIVSRKVDNQTKDIQVLKTETAEIKVATDGMKSALVEATRLAALAEGHEEGIKTEKLEQAIRAEGALSVTESSREAEKPLGTTDDPIKVKNAEDDVLKVIEVKDA